MAGAIYVVPAHERTTRLLWIPRVYSVFQHPRRLYPVLISVARWVTPIFVAFDVVSLIIQLIGTVSASSTQATDANAAKKLKTGKDVALAAGSRFTNRSIWGIHSRRRSFLLHLPTVRRRSSVKRTG